MILSPASQGFPPKGLRGVVGLGKLTPFSGHVMIFLLVGKEVQG